VPVGSLIAAPVFSFHLILAVSSHHYPAFRLVSTKNQRLRP
jgi:hypothetical protein